MKICLLAVCLMASASTMVGAFPSSVGLQVNGGASFGFEPGGGAAWSSSAPGYYVEEYNQSSYDILTRETSGDWQGLWTANTSGDGIHPDQASYGGQAISKAKADFGTLGVYSYAWVSERNPAPDNYWDWQTSASANAAFYDSWYVDASDINGTVGTLTVTVHLDGSRSDSWANHYSGLSWNFTNYSTGFSTGVGSTASAGDYVFTAPFKYGANNSIVMSLLAEASSFNASVGGESYVDFYHTASITGLTFRDASGNQISNYAMTTGSGHDYFVPEPASILSLVGGLGSLLAFRRRRVA